jgi:hypothetical protein
MSAAQAAPAGLPPQLPLTRFAPAHSVQRPLYTPLTLSEQERQLEDTPAAQQKPRLQLPLEHWLLAAHTLPAAPPVGGGATGEGEGAAVGVGFWGTVPQKPPDRG